MDIDFSAITSAQTYSADKEKLKITGSQYAAKIYLYIFLGITTIGIPYLIFIAMRYAKKNKVKNSIRLNAFNDFANRNGFHYETHTGQIIPIDQAQHSMDLPYNIESVVDNSILQGSLLGYNFRYTLSSVFVKNGNEASQFPTILFSLDLPVTLPKMFIDSKSNGLPGLNPKALNFIQAEDQELEGNFPDFYSVRIEKNEQIDMYTVLTPEVMEALVDNHQYDVWLNGQQLVFIKYGDVVRYFAGVPIVFKNAQVLMKEIDKIARALKQ